jgi:hypothetical protein
LLVFNSYFCGLVHAYRLALYSNFDDIHTTFSFVATFDEARLSEWQSTLTKLSFSCFVRQLSGAHHATYRKRIRPTHLDEELEPALLAQEIPEPS